MFIFLLAIALLFSGPELEIQATFTTADGLPSNEVRTLYNDGDQVIWAGTGQGTAAYDFSEWLTDTTSANPVTGGVPSLFKDSQDNMWFGGLGQAFRFDGITYTSFSIAEDMGLAGQVTFAFHEDVQGRIWCGTTGGIAIYDGDRWETVTMEDGLSHQVIHDIEATTDGQIWCATRRGGLNIFDGEHWTHQHVDKNCRKIFRDNAGRMWVGTSAGLLMFDGLDWQVFEEDHVILPMFEGQKGLIWCVADGTDIIRFAPDGQFILHENPCQDKAGEIYDLAYDSEGSVWAGTDQGIYVLH